MSQVEQKPSELWEYTFQLLGMKLVVVQRWEGILTTHEERCRVQQLAADRLGLPSGELVLRDARRVGN